MVLFLKDGLNFKENYNFALSLKDKGGVLIKLLERYIDRKSVV